MKAHHPSDHRNRFGPISVEVSKGKAEGRWPWLSPQAYWLLLDSAMEADALEALEESIEADPLGGSR